MSELQIGVLVICLVMNIVSFSLMAIDKAKAKKGAWRIPEKTLFLATICFGGIGGVLGMRLCRHKTKHWYFAVFFPIIMVLQLVALTMSWGHLG